MKKQNNQNRSMYGISRIDDSTHRGHAWRVSLKRGGKKHVRNFPDIRHGGKGRALRAAMRFRDDLIRKHRPITRREFADRPRLHNQSGVIGVCRFAKPYRSKTGRVRRVWYWSTTYPTTPGRKKTLHFSIATYGERRAFDLAVAARKRGLRQVHGVFWCCRE
jgi:hypothetical protein